MRYRIHLEDRQLAPETINVQLAAVCRLAFEAADAGLLSPDLAAGIRRVKGAQKLGVRFGNWLTAEEAHRLWQEPFSPGLVIKEIAGRFIGRHAEDFEWKVTPRWVGNVVRKKLGLTTYRRGGVYYADELEKESLASLFERCGLHEAGDADADGGTETAARIEDNLLLLDEVLVKSSKSCLTPGRI